MEIGSKLGIKKVKLVEPKNGEPFYLITAFEKVYNSKNPILKWETVFYNDVYVFDSSLELEEADMSLGVNTKDKFSFDNIANKDKAIIRVLDFKFEKHTVWKSGEQVKDDYGKPVLKDIHYLKKISLGDKAWRSDDGEFKLLKRKYEAQKLKIAEQKRKNLDKDVECRKKIKEITAEMNSLEQEVKKLKQIIEKQKQMVADAKISVKEANKQTMVARRENTLVANELEKAQNKIELEKQKVIEAKQEIKEVKKMKKEEVISKAQEIANEIGDFNWGDM